MILKHFRKLVLIAFALLITNFFALTREDIIKSHAEGIKIGATHMIVWWDT